ncbi:MULTISPECIES: BtrH N-terminal domain-containing protein [unclassified Bradyrhizobium]|uniref:BtrH N-terminal domain-containing protein n=1 Tax=unclassified Bradyrhizobium TaxID=2631580 RepID=UPI002916EF5E|nr:MULTISPECIES: BtrH N-terminal domain-containing protein [unclassified Bradyrhizobium]
MSCYTTSIATYLARANVDTDVALGLQLFLATRPVTDDPPVCAFSHYHTPLLGVTPTHTLHLRRKWTDSFEEARTSIMRECRHRSAVIISRDAYILPWSQSYQKKHAQHWFIVAKTSADGRVLHVVDRFQYADELGVQQPFEGQIACDALFDHRACSPFDPVSYWRSRLAFGQDDQAQPTPSNAFEWFEAEAPIDVRPSAPHAALELLAMGTELYLSRRLRPDLDGWMVGAAALDQLAAYAQAHLNDPRFYSLSDDFWVIARNRAYFCHALRRVSDLLSRRDLHSLSLRLHDTVMRAWSAIPRIMHYNAMSIERNREPRRLVVALLQQLASEEPALIEELDHLLSSR